MPIVDALSKVSLRVQPKAIDFELASATGFCVRFQDRTFLVSNWHVFSGRDANTKTCLDSHAAIPDTLKVYFHQRDKLGSWVEREVILNNPEGDPMWFEHPIGSEIDIACIELKLDIMDGVDIYPLDPSVSSIDEDWVDHKGSPPLAQATPLDDLPKLEYSEKSIVIKLGSNILIIGYPYGKSSGGGWPIWKTGHLATDIGIDFNHLPTFLVDATARKGMSGSPVIVDLGNNFQIGGTTISRIGPSKRLFLGVYAGRIESIKDIPNDIEIGRVFKRHALLELLESAVR